jgi:ribonuclease HI
VWFSEKLAISETFDGRQTNQRAEVLAVIRALQEVIAAEERVMIVTDSSYVVNAMTDHVFKWRENGWRNTRGDPVVNTADLKLLDDLVRRREEQGLDTAFAHISRKENAVADRLAKRAAKGQRMNK